MKSIPGEASEGKEGTKAGSLSYLGGKLSWVASCISLKHGAWKRWPWILEAELGDDELRYYIFCCGRFLAKCEGMSWFLLAAPDQLWKEGEGRIVTQKGTQDLLTFEKLSASSDAERCFQKIPPLDLLLGKCARKRKPRKFPAFCCCLGSTQRSEWAAMWKGLWKDQACSSAITAKARNEERVIQERSGGAGRLSNRLNCYDIHRRPTRLQGILHQQKRCCFWLAVQGWNKRRPSDSQQCYRQKTGW